MKEFGKENWIDSVEIDKYEPEIISKKEKREIVEIIIQSFNEHKFSLTLNYIYYLLLEDEAYFFSSLKRQGFFRFSNKQYDNNIDYILESILKNLGSCIQLQNKKYLESILSLHKFSPECKNLIKSISYEMAQNKRTFIKAIYSAAELLFINPNEIYEPNTESIRHYSKETVCESVSYLISLFNEKYGIKDIYLEKINESRIENCLNTILKAIKLLMIKDIEFNIETYGYSFNYKDNKNYELIPSSDDFEKSKILGFFVTEMQHYNSVLSILVNFEEKALSLSTLSEKLIHDNQEDLYKIKLDPVERLVLELPWTSELGTFFNQDELFLEELIFIKELAIEYHLDSESLSKMKFNNGVTLLDLIKLQRLINFLKSSFNKKIMEYVNSNFGLVFQSMIPTHQRDKWIEIIDYIFKNKQKTESIINMLTWNKTDFLDIQSLPLILGEYRIGYGLNILGTSNLFRNLCFLNKERIEIDLEILEKILCTCFKSKTAKCQKSIKYSYRGTNGDIDFITKIGNKVYIAECKNSLFGTTIYELRTNYDLLEKAKEQLDKIRNIISEKDFLLYLSTKLEFEIGPKDEIILFITSGNRNFYSIENIGYNVFPIYELISFVNTGELIVNNKKYSMYKNEEDFNENLYHYITRKTHQVILRDSLTENIINYRIGNKNIRRKTYFINHEKYEKSVERHFERI